MQSGGLVTGLYALDRLRHPSRCGYPVLADHLSDVLYVMVVTGSGTVLTLPTGVRILTAGDYLLVPVTVNGPGSPAAHWISPPSETPPLTATESLIGRLQELGKGIVPRSTAS
ncbi:MULTISPECIES: hypothetical protein [unclassified Streptomyces]|uniref:hypothetical protein n=1 Tax=unclassified Streptomyces TaxID=2593676 RepID=UPI0037F95678